MHTIITMMNTITKPIVTQEVTMEAASPKILRVGDAVNALRIHLQYETV